MPGIFDVFPEISEDEISLRRVTEKDAEGLSDLYDYPMKTESVRRMIRHYEMCYREKKEILIGFRYENQICGILELYHFEGVSCELGYRTCLHARGKGITMRAVGILLKRLKNTEVRNVYAWIEQNNHASRKILEDNGFILRKSEHQKCRYERNLTDI